MPRYKYKCEKCTHAWAVWHSMGEKTGRCPECGAEADIVRLPPSFTLKKEISIQKKKVGEVTKEFIEKSRTELKEQRREMKEVGKGDKNV